jgi:hypothetical protein
MLVIKDFKNFIIFLPVGAPSTREPGGLWVLRGVIHGFSEEARTLGFASQPFGWFAFIGCNPN